MRKTNPNRRAISFETYMAWEALGTRKHEFVRGEIFAMSGVTFRHDRITTNILLRLRLAERDSGCTAHSADVKVRPTDDVAYHPDVSVDCVPHHDTGLIVDHPCLVVEVTSPSSVRTDRGEKLENYSASSSLRMYLIVDHVRRRVTCHQRNVSGDWEMQEFLQDGTIDIPCPRMQLTLDEIYEGVELPPLGVAEPDEESIPAYAIDV